MGRVIEIVSPLAPEDCAARLAEAIDPGDMGVVPGSKPVIGRVSGRSVWLRKRIRYRNGCQTIVSGTLEEWAEGSRFRGRAGMRRATRVLASIWIGAMIALGVWNGVLHLARGGNPGGLLMAPLFVCLGAALVWFGRWLARDEERFLIAFLADVAGARQQSAAEPTL